MSLFLCVSPFLCLFLLSRRVGPSPDDTQRGQIEAGEHN